MTGYGFTGPMTARGTVFQAKDEGQPAVMNQIPPITVRVYHRDRYAWLVWAGLAEWLTRHVY